MRHFLSASVLVIGTLGGSSSALAESYVCETPRGDDQQQPPAHVVHVSLSPNPTIDVQTVIEAGSEQSGVSGKIPAGLHLDATLVDMFGYRSLSAEVTPYFDGPEVVEKGVFWEFMMPPLPTGDISVVATLQRGPIVAGDDAPDSFDLILFNCVKQ